MSSPDQEQIQSISHDQTTVPTSPLGSIGIDSDFLIAQIINFFVLLIVLRWLLYRPVLKILQKRSQTIEEGLAAAQKAQTQATIAQEEATNVINRAKIEAKTILEDAKKNAEELSLAIKKRAEQESDQLIKKTKEIIASEKADLLREVENQVAQLVIKASKKIINQQDLTISEKEIVTAIVSAKDNHD